MPTVDWTAATNALTSAARDQFTQFLAGPAAARLYGVGLFYDPDAGDSYPIANTIDHHQQEYGAHAKAGAAADEMAFVWDSGNWKYPAGLFASDAPEFLAFDRAWGPFRDEIAASIDPHRAKRFAEACVEALRRLAADGVFAPATNLMGYVVQSANDAPAEMVANQQRVTAAVTRPSG